MKSQLTFLDDAHEAVSLRLEGFSYRPEFISASDERALLKHFTKLPFREFEFHGFTGKRRVVSFGWRYDYSQRGIQKAADIPEFLFSLRSAAATFGAVEPEAFEQVLVSEYGPGAGIGWHRDKPEFGEVVGVSLLAPCTLRFRRRLGEKWERVNVSAEPCSAYHLTGPARADWQHSILQVDELRYSITFRTMSKN